MNTDRSWAEISLSAARHNYTEISRLAGVPAIATVKADAYGHGALPLAKLYEELGAPYLSVAHIDEAIELRDAGISAPILILGVTNEGRIPELYKYNITQSVASVSYAEKIGDLAPVHIKVDTGMGRLGVKSVDEVRAIAHLCKVEGIFTHFSDADCDAEYTNAQITRFSQIIRDSGVSFKFCHCANSAGVLHYKKAREFDLVRPGIILYGLYPDDDHGELDLKPVMSLKSRICDVREIKKGEFVSYGRTFCAPRDMRVAVLPIGYADGLRRNLSGKCEVFVSGERRRVLGRICMDMCIIEGDGVQVGDVCEIFGENISASELASKIDTISYEICTGISKRIPRIYL